MTAERTFELHEIPHDIEEDDFYWQVRWGKFYVAYADLEEGERRKDMELEVCFHKTPMNMSWETATNMAEAMVLFGFTRTVLVLGKKLVKGEAEASKTVPLPKSDPLGFP